MLQFVGSQIIGLHLATEQQQQQTFTEQSESASLDLSTSKVILLNPPTSLKGRRSFHT